MSTVCIKIDGKNFTVEKGSTILNACKSAGINIPTLCYLKDVSEEGVCGVCVVEVKGAKTLQRSCITEVKDGMEIFTNTPTVREARKMNLELALAHHNIECPTCERDGNCELQDIADRVNVKTVHFADVPSFYEKDVYSPVIRDPSKCIFCERCISVCDNIQSVSALAISQRGIRTYIGAPFTHLLTDTPCVNCGQCIMNCPTGALTERDDTNKVWDALSDPDKYVVVSTAPSIRASVGEIFGLPAGTFVRGKVATALKMMGFKKVFDTNFSADLTILEETHELIERIKKEENLPIMTSCCPAWIKFLEEYYPEFIQNVSSAKSPQGMMGAIVKSYFSQQISISPDKIFHVSIMPCTAKKSEAERRETWLRDFPDVDAVITTREFGRMIKQGGIDFVNLPDSEYDNPLGNYSGAGTIFGVTGGVMEAALRTAYDLFTGKELKNIEFKPLRNFEGIRVADVEIDGLNVRIAVANTLGKARELLEAIKSGKERIHFMEVMACPGGCIGEGGQLIPTNSDIISKRAQALYSDDERSKVRKSYQNPQINELYKNFLEKPGSEIAHKLLHTHYIKRHLWEKIGKSDF
ncbi:MAG: 2Fe-2S iron-sulfur cluster binding domain-containing protein [Proteobacteria bacterium]|nr:2Fe-2S iron-sulfur cluster binding domain-containing protein [Pseudomonadota bacterium]